MLICFVVAFVFDLLVGIRVAAVVWPERPFRFNLSKCFMPAFALSFDSFSFVFVTLKGLTVVSTCLGRDVVVVVVRAVVVLVVVAGVAVVVVVVVVDSVVAAVVAAVT